MRKKVFGSLLSIFRRDRKKAAAGSFDLHSMIHGIMTTREDEIACDDCFDLLDRYAELMLEGKSPEEQMPLVQHHLEHCPECKEEFEMLLKSLRSMQE